MAATDPDLLLRPASPDDVVALTEVYLAARSAATMPPVAHGDDDVRSWTGRELRRKEVWAAEDASGVVGFAGFTPTWLEDLYVAPQVQGQGVGSALLDLVKAQRPAGFCLWVFEVNEPARAFYRHRGLVELEHTDGSANEERSPDLRMAWLGQDPLGFLRGQIDAVDDDLAVLIARRAALTWAVQDAKAAAGTGAGEQGRDPDREAAIVERMAVHVPALAREQLARVMHTVIEESLAAWERRRS